MSEETPPPTAAEPAGAPEAPATAPVVEQPISEQFGTGFSGCVTILAVVGLLTLVIGGIIGSIAFTRVGAESDPEPPRFEDPEPYRDLRFEDHDCEERGPGLFGDDDRRFDDGGDAEAQFADDRTSVDWEEWCDDHFSHQLDFGALGRPTFRDEVRERSGDRYRELEIWLDEGRDDIDIGMWNPEPLPRSGSGIAVRTTNDARILLTDQLVTIERPEDCREGCRVVVWLSLGSGFQDWYPDAEVVIYAGRGADVTMESLSSAPREMYR